MEICEVKGLTEVKETTLTKKKEGTERMYKRKMKKGEK